MIDRDSLKPTKRNNPDGLKKASVEYEVTFDFSPRFRWNPKALGYYREDNDYHANQC
jgi:hypothetical protein